MAARLYVGNLPMDVKESELDDLFYKYGRIRSIDVKTPSRPPAFAFISYDDDRDAEDAVRGRDGYSFDGRRLRVEFSRSDRDRGDRGDRDRRGGRDGDRRDRDRDRDDRRRGGGAGRRSDYAIQLTNLPRGCSWQDLKDFMRKTGEVIYTDANKYGEGVVEFANREDMERALRTLDGTDFTNRGETSKIGVKALNKNGGDDAKDSPRGRSKSSERGDRDRSRSRDRRRSPSRSASPARERSNDREN